WRRRQLGQVEIDPRNSKRAFEPAPGVPEICDGCELDSAEIQIGRRSRHGRRRRDIGGMTAGQLLQLAEPGLELAVRNLEAVQIVLKLIEFRLLRGGVGVEFALDTIQLGVKRKPGSIARVGQSSLE